MGSVFMAAGRLCLGDIVFALWKILDRSLLAPNADIALSALNIRGL
jgi:hypothetical protein